MATIGGYKMNWELLMQIKKFTPMQEILKHYGQPRFILDSRPVLYLGNGFLISYTTRKFKIEGGERIEYGDEGQYALSVYYFQKKNELELYFKLESGNYDFEGDILGNSFEILEKVSLNSTYEEVTKQLRLGLNSVYYQEGETRAFSKQNFGFQNKFIMWGNYIFLFFGEKKTTKLSAFEFTFSE